MVAVFLLHRKFRFLCNKSLPQAIYKWLSGKSLPRIDNFIILSRLLHTTIEDILVIDGDISYYIGNFISYVIKASGRMRTVAYNEDVANDFYNL